MRTHHITLLIALFAACTGSFAQTTRFEAALQVGSSSAWLRGNKAIDDSDPLHGPIAGLSLQYNLSGHLGLRSGAGYQQKGSSTDITFTDNIGNVLGTGAVRSELRYLSFPLMLRYGFGDKLRVSAGVGGYVGILLSAQQTYRGFDFPDATITKNFEGTDIGLCGSISGALALGQKISLSLEARYDKGLTNISALPVVDDGSIRTNAVCMLLGCAYRFGAAL